MRDQRRSRDKTGFLSMTATDPASTGSLECAAPPATAARHHAPDRGALGITPCLAICSLGRHLIDGGHVQSYRHRPLEHDMPVSYTHLRAHETRHDLVCRLL